MLEDLMKYLPEMGAAGAVIVVVSIFIRYQAARDRMFISSLHKMQNEGIQLMREMNTNLKQSTAVIQDNTLTMRENTLMLRQVSRHFENEHKGERHD